ncbi:MAG: ribonuclease HII [Candidatus Paceibacterota bacterium]|jgi:ribonuclease HII
MDLQAEKKLWHKGFKTVVGLDEAGRGPLAGPVVAAAVAVDYFLLKQAKAGQKRGLTYLLEQVNDSKKLTAKKREEIYGFLVKDPFIKWGIAEVSEKTIDRINIFEASRLAMAKAIAGLDKRFSCLEPGSGYLVIDGNFLLPPKILEKRNMVLAGQQSVIKGDQKVFSIAAASILAKVYRDRIMLKLDKKYPQYGFAIHKGYPTKHHREMLGMYGVSVIHRKSFRPCFFCDKMS